MIIIQKIIYRVKSIIKTCFWKLLYFDKFKCGKFTFFYPYCHIILGNHGKILIGNNCFFNRNCSINSLEKITIGNDCIFGENVSLYDHNHKFSDLNKLIRKQEYNVGKIEIGNNCWIGSNVTILKGVSIGSNVIVGANTVIDHDIPSNVIVCGSRQLEIMERKGLYES